MAIAYFDPKIARGSDCGSYMGARFRYMGEVCTSVLFIEAVLTCLEEEGESCSPADEDKGRHMKHSANDEHCHNIITYSPATLPRRKEVLRTTHLQKKPTARVSTAANVHVCVCVLTWK